MAALLVGVRECACACVCPAEPQGRTRMPLLSAGEWPLAETVPGTTSQSDLIYATLLHDSIKGTS